MPGVTLQDFQRLNLSRITLDGTVVTATGAELNFNDVTAGTAEASKALVVDANKRVSSASIDHQYQTAATATTGTNLSAHGIINITTTAAKTFRLEAPRQGAQVHIISSGGSTLVKTISLLSGNFDGSGSKTKLLFNGINDAVTIVGISTARYIITSNVGSVATST